MGDKQYIGIERRIRMNIEWIDFLDAFIKMFLALICGGVLGIERGRKKRPAGFRTYMLVCLGATIVMMTNDYICQVYGSGDMARMGAQVVNGIGFLGAGTIITTGHNRVKGLTTAAGLWASACIGLAIGSGFYVGAILGTFMIVLIMVVLHSLDRRLFTTTRVLTVYIEFEKMSVLRTLANFATENNIHVEDVELEHVDEKSMNSMAALVTLGLPVKKLHSEVLEKISRVDGITYVQEI